MKDLIRMVKKTLSQKPVAFAYLVGSQAKKTTTPLSDIDIAVYTSSPNPPDTVIDIASELQGILGRTDVDVIDLNRAGLPIAHSLLKAARPILINNVQAERNFRRNIYRRYTDFQPTLSLIGHRTLKRIRTE
jgi:predicted nucleotidyltransferase